MKNQEVIRQKLSFLHDEFYNVEDFNCKKQREFLLNEIDYWKTELLKIQTSQRLKEIENEANKD
jgi:hypothetical protein